ncbi:MAG TPA: hypothetical protein VK763_14620 [Terriglobales bacterium]|nr:hypothetical protein [Terriglobales bacterium]
MTETRKIVRGLLLTAALLSAGWAIQPHPRTPALRWIEGQPGCTFSADDDGRYRYGLWTQDFGIVLAVDSLELQKAGRRTEPILTLLLTLRYRGKDSFSLEPSAITLEFVKHAHDLHLALDAGEVANKFRIDSDQLAKTTEREIQKYPEKKTDLESQLKEHQENIAQMLTFLDSRSLRTLKLDPVHPEASGWVYFSASSKWIGDWKKQEEFVLRIPLADQVVEFPFALPPSEGDLLLRRR